MLDQRQFEHPLAVGGTFRGVATLVWLLALSVIWIPRPESFFSRVQSPSGPSIDALGTTPDTEKMAANAFGALPHHATATSAVTLQATGFVEHHLDARLLTCAVGVRVFVWPPLVGVRSLVPPGID